MTDHATQLAGALKAEERKLLACVHCGLCLEACPTYAHTGDENDGPRGRLYLMRAVEEERLPVTSPSFTRHINRCLGCRACESACPAGVEYGQLLEAARADISAHERSRGFTARLLGLALRHVWAHPSRLRLAFRLARALRDAGVPRLALGATMKRLLPARLVFAAALLDSSSPAPLVRDGEGATHSPAASTASTDDEASTSSAHVPATSSSVKASVSPPDDVAGVGALLFEGCVTAGLFARVNRATARVLGANGCGTRAPEGQVCCGALHAHAGELEGARQLARRNVEAFGAGPPLPVVTNAGGCGAMLASYAQRLAHDAESAARARDFSARVRDVSQQLAVTGLREGAGVGFGAATYDASCHLLHGQCVARQ
ncbi:MAG TPA: heterodisulfide reductase-related iron-sulfur binding cluster, partial [Pyrinomonadaceae bacterium]